MTQTLSVRCQNCGSPLQVGESIRFVTCGYCHSELQVVRDTSTVHTEVLQRIEQNTQSTVNQLKVLEIQNDLERLDREWQMWREKNIPRDQYGAAMEPAPPTAKMDLSVAVFISIFAGLILMGILAVVGLPAIIIGIVGVLPPALVMIHRWSEESMAWFHRSHSKYEKTRSGLLKKLAQARHANSTAEPATPLQHP